MCSVSIIKLYFSSISSLNQNTSQSYFRIKLMETIPSPPSSQLFIATHHSSKHLPMKRWAAWIYEVSLTQATMQVCESPTHQSPRNSREFYSKINLNSFLIIHRISSFFHYTSRIDVCFYLNTPDKNLRLHVSTDSGSILHLSLIVLLWI